MEEVAKNVEKTTDLLHRLNFS
uniref:Uncharacterized protein n=1 Tax=Arundo donax TaxID=35708 RepID=A0A0A9C0W0_ARUDO